MKVKNVNIGLYFGSFNPVHVGHLALANYIVENSILDEIWFIVSPQNPYKSKSDLIEALHRVNMLEASITNYSKFKVCDIELNLPTPSYSYTTLRELSKIHPTYNFTIIMGSDNLKELDRWKNIDEIINNYNILVYPRPGYEIKPDELNQNISSIDAPVFDIDSTTIRKGLKEGKNYPFMIPKEAHQYIYSNNLYISNEKQKL